MVHNLKVAERRTSVDNVFDHLYEEIVSMRLLPGTKISEAEIAALFKISRQPVRDAFNRLENLGLLLIRPQKATEVKRFSSVEISRARFVRLAIEAEVLRRAAKLCDKPGAELLQSRLADQKLTVKAEDYDHFRLLDYQFHEALCEVGHVDFAFEVIQREKAKIDRLCVLSMKSRDERLDQLFDDHTAMATCVANNDEEGAVAAGMLHLSRIDTTISTIRSEHSEYFSD